MSNPPLRPCTAPGCGLATREGRCVQHKRKQQRDYDRARGSSATRGYGVQWRRVRRNHLSAFPLCAQCIESGRTVAGKIVHHLNEDPTDNRNDNLQTLCVACHNRAHPEKAEAMRSY